MRWDWNKKELVEGMNPVKIAPPLWLGVLIVGGYWFIEVVCPVLGRALFGGFL